MGPMLTVHGDARSVTIDQFGLISNSPGLRCGYCRHHSRAGRQAGPSSAAAVTCILRTTGISATANYSESAPEDISDIF